MSISLRAQSGNTGYKVELRSLTSATVVQTIPLVESGTSGEYFTQSAVTAAAGRYRLVFTKDDVFLTALPELYEWSGTAQITLTTLLNAIANVSASTGGSTAEQVATAVWAAGTRVLSEPVSLVGLDSKLTAVQESAGFASLAVRNSMTINPDTKIATFTDGVRTVSKRLKDAEGKLNAKDIYSTELI